jgi:Arc/MetJ-type ribon-helix-helix transcriptional regulator
MSTLNVKLPEGMEAEIEVFLEEHPRYMNKSELARDALRHMLDAAGTGAGGPPAEDDPLFSAPTVTVDDPVNHDEIDDEVYGDAER